jgi:scyllo-inositol 2-dehydrogenase (NADP+)
MTTMTESLKIGLAGYGYAGQTFHAPLIAGSGASVAAIFTSQAELARHDWPQAEITADFDALLAVPGLDAVVIATPNDTHFDLARRAIEAGKHVVVDKPLTVTLAEAFALEQLAAQHQRLVAPFHNRRWDGDFLTLKKLLENGTKNGTKSGTRSETTSATTTNSNSESEPDNAEPTGRLGRITHFESHFDRFRPLVRARWREEAARGGGILLDLGPHLLDQALALFGLPRTLSATLAAHRDGALADDYCHLVLGYPRHQVILHASTLAALGPPRFLVHGTRGSYLKHTLDVQEDQLKAGLRPDNVDFGVNPTGVLRVLEGTAEVQFEAQYELPTEVGTYTEFYRLFAQAVLHGAPLPVTIGEAIDVMHLIALAQESARTGLCMTVGEISRPPR